MATSTRGDIGGSFLVTNSGAVDPANHTAVASVDTVITVTAMDGTTNPLAAGDMIQLVEGFGAINAGIAVQNCKYTSASTLTLRTTNASAGAIDPASIAAGLLIFRVDRR